MTHQRGDSFQSWLKSQFSGQVFTIEPLTGDAGFRRYYRLKFTNHTLIAVDAPPDKSNNLAFICIAKQFALHGVIAPQVIAQNIEQGFFCITDLGNTLLSDVVTTDNMLAYYQKAIDNLLTLISIKQVAGYDLPAYDADFVALELAIFPDWLLNEHLAITLTKTEQQQLTECFNLLIENAISQPTVFMHRDYHSRNIMLTPQAEIAVIDFQDAVHGPITYDIVSLLRDCYLRWPDDLVNRLFSYFKTKVGQQLHLDIDESSWQTWFDLMGLQRHIKASGIFARLHHRDNKPGYLADIPLTLSYIVDISKKYPALAFLQQLIEQRVLPAYFEKAKQTPTVKENTEKST